MPDEQPVMRTAREMGSAMRREHSAPGRADGGDLRILELVDHRAAPDALPKSLPVPFVAVMAQPAGVAWHRTLFAAADGSDHRGAGAGPCARRSGRLRPVWPRSSSSAAAATTAPSA